MTPTVTLYRGDCLEVMRGMDADSVDSIVTDPPYGLKFMGKGWDHGVPGKAFWVEALQVAKPGAHMLAFGGTRTFHRLACAIEDASWEIRDTVMWVYGSGFPKSLDVSKAIDKAAGAEREVVGQYASFRPNEHADTKYNGNLHTNGAITAPATDAALQWQGWGTALKPAWEPIIVARKPLQGTVAANVLEWGTGALNVDGCRVSYEDTPNAASNPLYRMQNGYKTRVGSDSGASSYSIHPNGGEIRANPSGRWPANLIHDGSEEVLALMPESSGGHFSGNAPGFQTDKRRRRPSLERYTGDFGSAARFFYCAKASKKDRGDGNNHPTVKPTALMRYLCRLVTPPGGVVLDPFMGSGSTGKAAMLEGFGFIGIEVNEDYYRIAEARCNHARQQLTPQLEPAL